MDQEVLWMYHYTPQTSTQLTPYSLTYDIEAMISIEVEESSLKRQLFDLSLNQESLSVEPDLVNELVDRERFVKSHASSGQPGDTMRRFSQEAFKKGELV